METQTVTRDLTQTVGLGAERVASYPYRPRAWMLYAGIPLLVAFSVYLAWSALQHGSLHLWRLGITLSPHSAAVLDWSGFAVCMALSILGAVSFMRLLVKRYRVVLTDSALVLPPMGLFGRRSSVIPYVDVEEVSIGWIRNTPYVQIVHRRGKPYLVRSLFESDASFEAFGEKLAALCGKDIKKSPRIRTALLP